MRINYYGIRTPRLIGCCLITFNLHSRRNDCAVCTSIVIRVRIDHIELLTHVPGSAFQEAQWKTRNKRMSVRRAVLPRHLE